MQHIENRGGRVTLGMMADLIRGAGGGSFGISKGKGRKGKETLKDKAELDLDEIAGGKVGLNKDVGALITYSRDMRFLPEAAILFTI